MHLVEAYEIEPCAAQPVHHAFKKARRHLQKLVGLKGIRPPRAHVMQGEDRADATDEALHQRMGAGEIERLQACPNDGFLQSVQCPNPVAAVSDYPNSLLTCT